MATEKFLTFNLNGIVVEMTASTANELAKDGYKIVSLFPPLLEKSK